MSVVIACLVTFVAGYLGSAILGTMWNWPDAGAIVAIAVMGGFILAALHKQKQ